MNDRVQPSWLMTVGNWSSVTQTAILLATFAALLAGCAPIGWWIGGQEGLLAAVASIGVCAFASLLALVLGQIASALEPTGSNNQKAGNMLLPMAVGSMTRLAFPLLAFLFVQRRMPNLLDAGFPWFLLVAFMTGLAIETVFLASKAQLNSTP